MPIRLFLERYPFGSEDIASMLVAFEAALDKLGLAERKDPAAIAVAKVIIGLAKEDERDPRAAVRPSIEAEVGHLRRRPESQKGP